MFARLTIVQTKVDKMDEAVKVSKESVLPAAFECARWYMRIWRRSIGM